MTRHFTFPKSCRLVSNRQFKAVLDHGRRRADRLLVVYAAPNDCGHPRLGISIGKPCGNAVIRNRLKRLLREVFRRHQDRIPQNLDYVVTMAPSFLRRCKRTEAGRGSPNAIRAFGGPRRMPTALTLPQVQESFLCLVGALAR
jgi:ribonuclease P protein component